MSETKSKFLTKVSEAQIRLKAPKNQRNSFGNYNYRSCEDILEAVKPILNDLGLVLNLSDSIELVGERYYVKATATLYDTESDSTLTSTAYAREPEDKKGTDASQVTGASSSYARKYALNGLLNCDDTKDADTDEFASQTGRGAKAEAKPKTEPKEAPKEFKCQRCGAVMGEEVINKKTYSAEQVIKASMNKYGKCLCQKCREAQDAATFEKKGLGI